MTPNKPRIIKDFEKLDVAIQEQIKLLYPKGFTDSLITFSNKEGRLISALPFETDDHYYLVKMTAFEAQQIVDDDSDYDEDGVLKDDVREDYEDKYADLDYLKDNLADEE
jgi:hypothetical protein